MIDRADTPDAIRKQATDWFALRDETVRNPITRQRFEQWRDADPRHATAYAELAAMWESRAFEQALKNLASELELPPAPQAPTHRKTRFMAAAAAVLITLGIG